MKTTTNEETINTCFNIIKNAVGQVEIFEKKAERYKVVIIILFFFIQFYFDVFLFTGRKLKK